MKVSKGKGTVTVAQGDDDSTQSHCDSRASQWERVGVRVVFEVDRVGLKTAKKGGAV